MTRKFGLVALVVIAIGLAWHFGLMNALTLSNLKARKAEIDASYAAHPVLMASGFFLLYVATAALSIPGAVILTLASGAIFGLVAGTLLVSFASSLGGTLAFLGSRYLFRDWVKQKFGARMQDFDEGFARDGAFYLLTLRLMPVVPYFLINLLMGLTAIRTRTFYLVSQAGMLLATLVYVNAGTRLAEISALKDIASPLLIGSLVALSLVPLIGRWVVGRINQRRRST